MFLGMACCQWMAAPAVEAAQNYALSFKGGDTNSLQENGDFVDLGYMLDVFPRGPKTIEFWCKVTKHTMSNMVFGLHDPAFLATRSYLDDNNNGGALRFYANGAAAATINNTILYDKVQHIAIVDTGSALRVYRDGQQVGTANVTWNVHPTNASRPTMQIGRGLHSGGSRYFQGWMDEFRIWNVARTQTQIQETMKVELLGDESGLVGYWNFNEGTGTTAYDNSPNKRHGKVVGATWITDAAPVAPVVAASGPTPGPGVVDLPRDVGLSWRASPDGATRDVYFGAVFADVNNASRTSPLGVLVSQGQTATTYQPPTALAYGKTYYWRIDEISAPPSTAISTGKVWSLTIEPYAYPIKKVTATASSAQVGMGPEKTVDGSGLDSGNQHSTELKDMWLSGGTQPNWIQFAFDKVYQLQELWIWNSNQLIESIVGFGAKSVTVEYSVEGSTWTPLGGVPEFAKATGQPTYVSGTTVNLGGVSAKYVKLTINSSWSGVPQASLSEVRFFYIPVQAREPGPVNAAAGVGLDATLNWRPGRGAASHQVLLGTEKEAVVNGTAPAQSASDNSFSPASLDFGTTYYWRVDEVNAVTHPGEVWSFTTLEYQPIEDFESYTDKEGNEIFATWIDGFTDGLSGSIVGLYPAAINGTFCETTIIHGGKQSMPMDYNNVKSPFLSEATDEFSPVQDWTVHGATDLRLWFRGRPVAFIDKGNGAFTISGSGHDIWNEADDFRFACKRLDGDGSIVVKTESLINTDVWAKAGVMIRESLEAGSPMAYMIISYSSGASFGWRLTPGVNAASAPAVAAIRAPQWVKLTRKGNVFTAQYSADGQTWLDIKNPTLTGTVVSTTINMTGSVYIGLCVTSHNTAATTTAEFSGAATTGAVTGAWQVAEIGDDPEPANSPAPIYVVVQDSAGKNKVVSHPNSLATTTASWQEWRIPLSEFASAGVKLTAVKKLVIGVGDRANPQAGGAGKLYIDDIGFGHPATGR